MSLFAVRDLILRNIKEKMKKSLLAFAAILFLCGIAFAQENADEGQVVYGSIIQEGNRTVYVMHEQVTASDLQIALDEINLRLANLELAEIKESMSFFDYLSIINLVLLLILLFILLKKVRRSTN